MTQTVTLPGANKAVEEALLALENGSNTVVLTGPQGAGKSAALHALSQRKTVGRFKSVVLIAPPESRGNPDAAMVGLVDLAVQLDPKLLDEVKRPDITWKGKLDRVVKVLRHGAGRTLLLFDGPFFPQGGEYISSVFADRAADLTRTLLGTPGVNKIVAAERGALLQATEVVVSPRSMPSEILAPEKWDSLAPFAQTLLTEGGEALAGFSPLDLRLRVGLVALGGDAAELSRKSLALHKLVRLLLEGVGTGARDLKKVLGRLAIFRIPIDEDALTEVGVDGLDTRSLSLVRQVLLFGSQGRWQLHEAIVREAVHWEWLTAQESREAHRSAARYHQVRFEHARKLHHVRQTVRHELEVIHHLTQAGDAKKLLERSLFFVEQYDALGKALSEQGRHDEAIPAYERALAHDPGDAYAHHYLAYNLDVLAREPGRVEQGFRQAVRYRPDHVWYRGRFINFLVTRGRIQEAREEWERALAVLLPAGPSTDGSLYRELHGETARLLLHRGQLEFSEEVLEEVPPTLREGLPWYRALWRLREHLVAAARDEEVFPPHLAEGERWSGPHLLHLPSDRQRVEWWMPGRIAAADEEGIHVRAARRAVNGDGVRFLWYDLSIEEYQRLARHLRERDQLLPAGTYVEFIKLREEEEFLKSFPASSFNEPDLPRLYPPPDRYLRRVASSS